MASPGWPVWAPAALLLVLLSACSTPPKRTVERVTLPPLAQPAKLYIYPGVGQSAEQQDRDRFECYHWAVQQTGFDPNQSRAPLLHRVEVVPNPPSGTHTVVGALSGAAIGAAVAPHHRSGEGALVGAVAGAVIGAVSDASRQAEAKQVQERLERRQDAGVTRTQQQSQEFRRAMSACLEGRSYHVQ